jgi:hypothetical protein
LAAPSRLTPGCNCTLAGSVAGVVGRSWRYWAWNRSTSAGGGSAKVSYSTWYQTSPSGPPSAVSARFSISIRAPAANGMGK